jgi:Xaa-Pro aminopeptidase
VLFCRNRDSAAEIWTGRRAGPEGAKQDFGADEAFNIDELDKLLPGLLEGSDQIYYTLGLRADFDQRVIGWLDGLRRKSRSGVRPPSGVMALDHPIHEMRLFKSPAEQVVMRQAGQITAAAHRRAMLICQPGMYEYQLAADYSYDFNRHGGTHAYSPIVGGGRNACVLHYEHNDAVLRDGDLVLVDAGAEIAGYAADITRTFPVGVRFSAEQKAIYEIVLAAQAAAIDKVRPGNRWNEGHDAAVAVLSQGLIDLGLLTGPLSKVLEEQSYRRFYMHRTGHWLGMDVHDVGEYKTQGAWRALEPGMVLTVEPGLYIPAGSEGVDERWWNIGVRIEDDVLVTANGHDVLTIDAPKSVADIEALRTAGLAA